MLYTYETAYNEYHELLNENVMQAQNHLNTYTPNNVEQEYKHNYYNNLNKIKDVFEYYFNGSLSYEITMCMLVNYLIEKHKECKRSKEVGISEVYFNNLHDLYDYDIMREYMNDNCAIHNYLKDIGITRW